MHSKRQILHFREKSSKLTSKLMAKNFIINIMNMDFRFIGWASKGGLKAAECRGRGKIFSLRGK